MSFYNFIGYKVDDLIATITLNRPEKRNAFTPTMVSELEHAIATINQDKGVRLVILRAAAPTFCAGMDLKVFQNPDLDVKNENIVVKKTPLGSVMALLEKPSIAIVEGDVIAGGFLLVLGCTYVFAKQSVSFSLPEVKRGIFPFQVMVQLLKYMPEHKALDLCITGRTIHTPEALKLGLVSHVLSEDYSNELNNDATLSQLIHTICDNAPKAIQAGIKALRQLKSIAENSREQFMLDQLEELKKSQDAHEGALAFFEKRKANWTGE